jgi:hypothetical protein
MNARIVKSAETIVARQWFGSDHVVNSTDTNVTIEGLLEAMFFMRFLQTLYTEVLPEVSRDPLRGGGFEYFHGSPVSRRRRRKGTSVPDGITGPPYFWGYKYGDLVLQVEGVTNLRQ